MGKWQTIYQRLQTEGLDLSKQLEGSAWINRFTPYFDIQGKMLDLGCGMGADMLRCAQLGFEPYGLDLEEQAIDFVKNQYGFNAQCHNFSEPLPYQNGMFSLVISRFALHYLRPTEAQKLFKEIKRVLKPKGKLLFLVNSEIHRQLGLQYDYSNAIELEPNVWHLPNDMKRTFLFYTPALTKDLLGEGWAWLYLKDEAFTHWEIEKRIIIGLAEKV